MSRTPRTGRLRPQGGGVEVAIWYLMRLTGVALFVLALAHYLIVHLVFDPSSQTAAWIIDQRWNQLFWRAFDWTLLMMVLFHGFMGVRTVIDDYAGRPRVRIAVLTIVYLLAALLFVIGTLVVLTLPVPGEA